jgi:hypothetical protein
MNNAPATKKSQTARLRRNEEKWSKALMDAGWTALPSILLEKQAELKLDPKDINIILHLASFWWYSNNLPYPSKARLAAAMKVDVSTSRRHITKMVNLGYIERVARFHDHHNGQDTNFYNLEGLIKAATPFAIEKNRDKAKRAEARAAGKAPKNAKLKLVGGKNANVP